MDDTFSVFNSFQEAGTFHLKLNSLHLSLRFTLEVESDSMLTLFAVLVERNEFTVGRILMVFTRIGILLSLSSAKLT